MDKEPARIKEIKPVLTGYIRSSIILLAEENVPSDRAVHDVRVLMKKARAALKLLSGQPGLEKTGKDLAGLREVGRKMRRWREDCVHRKTLRELKKDYPGLFEKLTETGPVSQLLKKKTELSVNGGNIAAELESVMTILKKTGYRIRFLTMNKPDHAELFRQLDATYKRVVNNYLISRNSRKPEDIHEFRKSAKDLLYQIAFFRPLSPGPVKTLEKRLDVIAGNLGGYNDLAQLLVALGYKYSPGRNIPAMDELVLRIRERQDKYLEKTWPAAFRVFCPGQELARLLGFTMIMY